MKRTYISAKMTIVRNNLDQDVEISGYVWHHTDQTWGADEDGNRGVKRTFVDDVTEMTAEDDQGETIALTKEEQEKASNILGIAFLEES